jgi:site-specific recombinase XerD
MQKEIKEYLEWKGTYAVRAATNYKIWLDKFAFVVEKPLAKIEVGDIVKYQHWLSSHYQPASVMLGMIVISNFFKFFRLQGVQCLPPELIKIPKCRANSYQPIKPEEYVKMLEQIHPTNFWELQKCVMLRLLFEIGMRVSELTDLNIQDIDTEKCSAVIRTKKTDRVRQIFWSRETSLFLKEHVRQRKEYNSTPALFVGRFLDGTPSKRITPRTIQRMIKDLANKAGISNKLTPHSFRHGKAHRILEMGGNVAHVQKLLGHSDRNPAASFTYLQMSDCEFERIAKKFL